MMPTNLSPSVIAGPLRTFVVGVAEMIASNDPGAEIIAHWVGSCLGVVVYDPVRKAGGLLHYMLPDSTIDPIKAMRFPFMFADTGLPGLFRAVYELGGEKSRLQVKGAGGARFLDDQGHFDTGFRNLVAFQEFLDRNGFSPGALEIGGQVSRTVRLDLTTGQVSIRIPGRTPFVI